MFVLCPRAVAVPVKVGGPSLPTCASEHVAVPSHGPRTRKQLTADPHEGIQSVMVRRLSETRGARGMEEFEVMYR